MFCLVTSVSGRSKSYLEEQALVVGTKQSRLSDKAGRLTMQAGRQCRQADKAGQLTSRPADKAGQLTKQAG